MATVSLTVGVLGLGLSACAVTTTQDKAARIQLNSARTREAMAPVKLGTPDTRVQVTDVQVIRAKGGTAFVVALHNDTETAVSDLPLAVGVEKGGEEQWLNLAKGTPYFQSHIPAIEAGGELVWVYLAKDDVPEGKPLATVGSNATQEIVADGSFPALTAAVEPAGAKDSAKGALQVTNPTDIPQYGLEAYVVAADGDEYRAAGVARIQQLDPGADWSKSVSLIGDPGDGELEAFVQPTILK